MWAGSVSLRLMQQAGIQGVSRRRGFKTTTKDPAAHAYRRSGGAQLHHPWPQLWVGRLVHGHHTSAPNWCWMLSQMALAQRRPETSSTTRTTAASTPLLRSASAAGGRDSSVHGHRGGRT